MTPTKLSLERSNSIVDVPEADSSKVTHTQKLDILGDIYSLCLKGMQYEVDYNLFMNKQILDELLRNVDKIM